MLYVFHVDTGSMMTLEMKLTLEKVIILKEAIYKETKIPIDKQVLLISGGEALAEEKSLSHYHAGTDTNPIFLFSIAIIEANVINRELDFALDPEVQLITNINHEINEGMQLHPCYRSVQTRAELTQKIYLTSKEQLNSCKKIVLYQHLQQQGWHAVLVNLEDIICAVEKQYESCSRHFTEYLNCRDNGLIILDKYRQDSDFKLLERIPVLPTLLKKKKQTFDEASIYIKNSQLDFEPSAENSCKLIDLIIAKGQSNTDMINLAHKLKIKLIEMNPETFIGLQNDYAGLRKDSEERKLKEIEGLSERFLSLENRIREGEAHVKELNNIAKSFQSNLIRAKSVNDESIYPVLCNSQVSTLIDAKQSLTKIQETRITCLKAKNELSSIIIYRLKWILILERRADDLRSKLMMYMGYLKRLNNELQRFDQIDKSPVLYFQAVAEVIRRKYFNDNFIQWTFRLSEENKAIWEKEVGIRENFIDKFSGSFLKDYFTGLNDIPPAFATEPPELFDEELPQIKVDCLQYLCEAVPEFAHLLEIEDGIGVPMIIKEGLSPYKQMEPCPYLSDTRSREIFSSAMTSTIRTKDSHSSTSKEYGTVSPISVSRPTSLLKEQPESETDTEEFEKICCGDETYSPIETLSIKLTRTTNQKLKNTDDIGPESASPLQEEFVTTEIDELIESSQNKVDAQSQKTSQELPALKPFILTLSQINLQSTNTKSSIEGKPFTFDKVLLSTLESDLHDVENKIQQGRTEEVDISFKKIRECMAMIGEKCALDEKTIDNSSEDMLIQELEHLKHQLSDANKEIDIYQQEILKQKRIMQQTESEFDEDKRVLLSNKDDVIVKLTLEHEVEMENLKESHQHEMDKCQEISSQLESKLQCCEDNFKTSNELIEVNIRTRLEAEKVKIVDILETNFRERERKTLEQLKNELITQHELVLNELKNEHHEEIDKIEHISELSNQENATLNINIEESEDKHNDELRKCRELWEVQKDEQLSLLQADHKVESEKSKLLHKLEIDNLRSRFRLMTMDKSPSETSLEKFEKGDFIDLSSHDEAIIKLKEELLKEKSVALEALEVSHKTVVEQMEKALDLKLEEEEKRMSNEKQKNPEAGSDGQVAPVAVDLSPSNIKKLIKDNMDLKNALFRQTRGELKVSMLSCEPYDFILVVYDGTYNHYRIFLEDQSYLHFVRPDCYKELGLSKLTTHRKPEKKYCLAEIVKKELCQAKKADNRFRVPLGTRFYRVTAKSIYQPSAASCSNTSTDVVDSGDTDGQSAMVDSLVNRSGASEVSSSSYVLAGTAAAAGAGAVKEEKEDNEETKCEEASSSLDVVSSSQ